MRVFAALLILGAGAAECARPQPSMGPNAALVLPRDLAGCYALYGGQGAPVTHLYFAPPQVRLDTTRASWPNDNGRTSRAARLDARGRPLADDEMAILYWHPDSLSDTIHVVTSSGFSGTELIVAPGRARRDTLRGRAVEHWDMGPSSNEAGAVMLARVPCVAAGTR